MIKKIVSDVIPSKTIFMYKHYLANKTLIQIHVPKNANEIFASRFLLYLVFKRKKIQYLEHVNNVFVNCRTHKLWFIHKLIYTYKPF